MTGQPLDPFGYWPAQRSRVRPLGGTEKADDPNYVFHTPYVPVSPGASVAEVAFDALKAESGMIAVRIFQHLASGNPAITEKGKTTALFPSIAKTKRPIRVAFEAVPDATYAIAGYVFGECEARAAALDIRIDPRPTENDDPLSARSLFGRRKARRVATLAASAAPSLTWPVSQGFTTDQTRELHFQRLAGSLPAHVTPTARWETAYIVRVLEQYGRIVPGARGLGLAMEADPAAAHVAQAGCDMCSVVLAPGETIADACARQLPGADAGRGFDFLWSRSAIFGAGGSARAIGLIEELLERLRPGGLGTHLVTTGGEMDRHALNRIALGLAALGHIVAQLRYVPDAGGAVPFGIVVRKSTDEIIT